VCSSQEVCVEMTEGELMLDIYGDAYLTDKGSGTSDDNNVGNEEGYSDGQQCAEDHMIK